MMTTGVVRFGAFRLDARSGELFRDGRAVRLPPQASKLLVYLASSSGELVGREEIQRALWGDDTFVDFEHGINKCINQIRAALGDDADEPRYVETVPRRGYRFLVSVDVETETIHEIASFGNRVSAVALDPTGAVAVTGGFDGLVRVGPVLGGESHLLYGHALEVSSVAVSPDGKWIASGSQDGTIRLWPMPEGTPFHTLPYEELLKRLRELTNLRVVPDASSDTGYRVTVGPFPGWKNLPKW